MAIVSQFLNCLYVKKCRKYRRSRGVVDAAIMGFSGIQFANKDGLLCPLSSMTKSNGMLPNPGICCVTANSFPEGLRFRARSPFEAKVRSVNDPDLL